MGGLDTRRALADELKKFRAEKANRACRQPIAAIVVFLILPDGLEIGPENEVRCIDEEDVITGLHGTGGQAHGSTRRG